MHALMQADCRYVLVYAVNLVLPERRVPSGLAYTTSGEVKMADYIGPLRLHLVSSSAPPCERHPHVDQSDEVESSHLNRDQDL